MGRRPTLCSQAGFGRPSDIGRPTCQVSEICRISVVCCRRSRSLEQNCRTSVVFRTSVTSDVRSLSNFRRGGEVFCTRLVGFPKDFGRPTCRTSGVCRTSVVRRRSSIPSRLRCFSWPVLRCRTSESYRTSETWCCSPLSFGLLLVIVPNRTKHIVFRQHPTLTRMALNLNKE